MRRPGPLLLALAITTGVCVADASPAVADVVPRNAPAAGSVIARKAGEEVRFIDVSAWRFVDVSQDLLAGDVLRTNALGHLAVLFSDHTQVRLGRNTTLLVKAVGESADSRFGLESGTIWARAERGGIGLTIDTPAAAAAIRGTDWTMTVGADGRTSLIVLEGVVELSNAQGSVTVRRGEGAVARIGEAPTRIVIVNPDDREQMLFYYSLKGAFSAMPASPLAAPRMRTERARIAARPEALRTAEDWLTLAEASLSFDGRKAALAAADRARSLRLTGPQRARLDLIDALVAGAEQRYADAARLFAKARPRLDRRRAAIAAYGGYFARALSDPDRAERPPSVGGAGPYAIVVEAMTAGFLQDIESAIAIIRRGEARYPDDPTLPAIRARFALLIDDRQQVEEAIGRSLALDPDDPNALLARATYRANFRSDLGGALEDLDRAARIAPGDSEIWNMKGLVLGDRGATREAEAAFRHAIELDPEGPVARANMAILFLDQSRLEEAKAEIDRALALDPEFGIGLVARGRYHLQTGEMDKALQDLLAGSTANPAYAQGLLLLGADYYESGDRQAADQALDNADRLNPNDPVTSSARTAIAIDAYEADAAISSAEEGLRRARARGGDFATVSANRDAGSTLNSAFRLLDLNEWGRYYGDVVFDPFTASGYIDQAVAGSVNPYATDLGYGHFLTDPVSNTNSFSSYLQGVMLDPLLVASRQRSANLVRRPFLEGSIAGGVIADGGDPGWTGEAEIQGYSATPVPWSIYGKIYGQQDTTDRNLRDAPPLLAGAGIENDFLNGTVYVTVQPTPDDRVVAFGNFFNTKTEFSAIPDPAFLPPGVTGLDYSQSRTDHNVTGGIAWSHTFGYRNVGSIGVFGSSIDEKSESRQLAITPFGPLGTVADIDIRQRYLMGSVGHAIGIDDLTLRYGVEAGMLDLSQRNTLTLYLPPFEPVSASTAADSEAVAGRAYVDAIYDLAPNLKLEGALFGTYIDGGSLDVRRLEPRLAAAWSPVDGQWLRAGFLRETALIDSTTLAPVGVLGLQSNQNPLDPGGYSDTFAARWDAEWNAHFFTSVEYQHQELNDLAIPTPFSLATIDIPDGRIDRVSATANVWLGGGFGLFGTYAHAESKNTTAGPDSGRPLPFVPEHSARFGVTYVHPSNVKVTLAETYVGPHTGDAAGTPLGSYWTTDAFLTWEPFDKRFALDLAGYNLTDEYFEVSPAAAGAPGVPGWGRTFVGSLKIRF